MKIPPLCAAVAAAAFLAGCGGGGHSGSSTSTIRQIQVGDSVIYAVTGTATDSSGTVPVTGTANFMVNAAEGIPKYGSRVMAWTLYYTLVWRGSSQPLIPDNSWFEQGSDGTIYQPGFKDGWDFQISITSSTAPPVMYFSPMVQGQSSSYTLTYYTGYQETDTVAVGAAQQISGMTAFEVDKTWTYLNQSGSLGPEWFAPSLGFPAKLVTTPHPSDNSQLSLTLTYSSKNF